MTDATPTFYIADPQDHPLYANCRSCRKFLTTWKRYAKLSNGAAMHIICARRAGLAEDKQREEKLWPNPTTPSPST